MINYNFPSALWRHVCTHFKQPMQYSELMITACLWKNKFILPITLKLHTSRHIQHASQNCVTRLIYLVGWVLLCLDLIFIFNFGIIYVDKLILSRLVVINICK